MVPDSSPPIWNGGRFKERLVFPKSFTPNLILNGANGSISCGDTSFSNCIEEKTIQAAKQSDVLTIVTLCKLHKTQRAVADCYFSSAEKMPISSYGLAVDLCYLSEAYGPECHNHLILEISRKYVVQPCDADFLSSVHMS